MPLLLVDDDLGTRTTLSIALRRRGFEVDLAEDGLRALRKVRMVPYDWVISDVVMPGMSGIDLVREVKRLRPECKIAMISAYDFPQEAEGMGVAGCLDKPVDTAVLCKLLRGK